MRTLCVVLLLTVAACGRGDVLVGEPPTIEERLTGAWTQLGIEEEGVFRPIDDGTSLALVFHGDGTGSYGGTEGDVVLEEACSRPVAFEWTLSADESTILVTFPGPTELMWRIVDIDAAQLTFDEGGDRFPFAFVGECS